MEKFIVPETASRQRVDKFIASQLPQYSRSTIRTLFDSGDIKINGEVAEASDLVSVGDDVHLNTSPLKVEPPKIEIPILYEDDRVIVLDKPAGVLTHSKGAINEEATVASFIKPILTDDALTGNRAGIVHRLDRATSGVIISAKDQPTLKWLQKQFSTRKVTKTYVAVVSGTPNPRAAIIDAPIGRNPRKPQSFEVSPSGRDAQTKYEVINSIERAGKSYSLLKVNPLTGRTHQIRVHLAYTGHPVVGDSVYGKRDGEMLLHALSLKIRMPDGLESTFEAPLPERFKEYE